MPYLPWVMSKFLGLGFTLEQVITMATVNPARVIARVPRLGTLANGAPADLSMFELIEGPVSFVDTRNNRRDGKAYLKPWGTVAAGVVFGRPVPGAVHGALTRAAPACAGAGAARTVFRPNTVRKPGTRRTAR